MCEFLYMLASHTDKAKTKLHHSLDWYSLATWGRRTLLHNKFSDRCVLRLPAWCILFNVVIQLVRKTSSIRPAFHTDWHHAATLPTALQLKYFFMPRPIAPNLSHLKALVTMANPLPCSLGSPLGQRSALETLRWVFSCVKVVQAPNQIHVHTIQSVIFV